MPWLMPTIRWSTRARLVIATLVMGLATPSVLLVGNFVDGKPAVPQMNEMSWLRLVGAAAGFAIVMLLSSIVSADVRLSTGPSAGSGNPSQLEAAAAARASTLPMRAR